MFVKGKGYLTYDKVDLVRPFFLYPFQRRVDKRERGVAVRAWGPERAGTLRLTVGLFRVTRARYRGVWQIVAVGMHILQ